MFTGIAEGVGKVLSITENRGQKRIAITTKFSDLCSGETILVNGVALSVLEIINKNDAMLAITEKQLSQTNLRNAAEGTILNLERAVLANGRLGGHFVHGNIDATAMLLSITPHQDHHRLTLALDPKFGRYCIENGVITLNGISLVISSLEETKAREFMISCIVPALTWRNSNFDSLKSGDALNVEVDVLAKYIERLCPFLDNPILPQ